MFKINAPRTKPLHLQVSTSRRQHKVEIVFVQLKIVKLQIRMPWLNIKPGKSIPVDDILPIIRNDNLP